MKAFTNLVRAFLKFGGNLDFRNFIILGTDLVEPASSRVGTSFGSSLKFLRRTFFRRKGEKYFEIVKTRRNLRRQKEGKKSRGQFFESSICQVWQNVRLKLPLYRQLFNGLAQAKSLIIKHQVHLQLGKQNRWNNLTNFSHLYRLFPW